MPEQPAVRDEVRGVLRIEAEYERGGVDRAQDGLVVRVSRERVVVLYVW